MSGYENYGRNPYGYGGPYGNMYGTQYFHNMPSWGYIIFYLIVLLVGIIGNAFFCIIIKKNQPLHRTIHFFLVSLAIRDMIVCLSVIPFILDSLAKRQGMWELNDILCKVYICIDYSMKGVHAFTLLLAAYFLYFHYRKNESYATETGEIVRRQTRMHKWGIPLAWVIGVGVSAPAGALASMWVGTCAAWHEYGQMSGTNFYMNLAFVIGSFIVPWALLMFPLIALAMQVCGGRTPRLDPPHSRTAVTILLYILVFIGTRAPHDIYELMKMLGNEFGNKGDPLRGMPPMWRSPETQLALNCVMYLPCILHPLLLIIVNPDYRQGFKNVWRSLYCNKDSRTESTGAGGDTDSKRGGSRYPPPQPIIKQKSAMRGFRQPAYGDQLIAEVQPMIMPAQQHQQQRPLLNQMSHKLNQSGGPAYLGSGAPYIPMYPVSAQHEPLMNNSFEIAEPSPNMELPAKFQYGQFNYIDTAREEPKIAYTPTNTPPKTPQMPHFDYKPFKQPNYIDGTWIMPSEQEAYTGLMPASQIPLDGYPLHAYADQMQTSSVPIEVDDEIPEPMEIESLENSPGNTLRTARRGRPEVTSLTASPGARRRDNNASRLEETPRPFTPNRLESAPPRVNGYRTAAEEAASKSRPTSPANVEISLSGRSRSRQDLCPDLPRSKFEHAV